MGYLNAFCCLFVAKLPLTFAKLNSIPLNRARGPLNEISMLLRLIELNFNDSISGKNAFRMHSLHSGNAFRMHSLLKPRTKNQDFPKTPEQILVQTKTKNQDFPRTPEQILVRTKTKNQEPRFPQDSWANLVSNQNQEPRTKIQDSPRTPEQILVRTKTKNQDSPTTAEQILVRTKNQESRTKICSGVLGESWFLVLNLGFPKAPEQILDLRS